MMKNRYLVVISPKVPVNNFSVLQEIHSFGFKRINNVEIKKIYSLSGNINKDKITFITESLLADTVSESYKIVNIKDVKCLSTQILVNIWYKPQVLDVEAMYVLKGIKYLGIKDDLEVHSGKQIVFYPKIDKKSIRYIIEKIFMNSLIQYYEIV